MYLCIIQTKTINKMKRILLAIMVAGCTLAMSAQIKVNYKGAKPAVDDFVWALVNFSSGESDSENQAINLVRDAMENYRKNVPQPQGITFTVDKLNGFVLFEEKQGELLLRIEMCYWNESDNKHKLFAFNTCTYLDGQSNTGEFDGLFFYRYENATKTMEPYYSDEFDAVYTCDLDGWNTFSLPRQGKDIVVTTWYDDAPSKKKTLKWNGHCFNR